MKIQFPSPSPLQPMKLSRVPSEHFAPPIIQLFCLLSDNSLLHSVFPTCHYRAWVSLVNILQRSSSHTNRLLLLHTLLVIYCFQTPCIMLPNLTPPIPSVGSQYINSHGISYFYSAPPPSFIVDLRDLFKCFEWLTDLLRGEWTLAFDITV